jgi:hypothetical protein
VLNSGKPEFRCDPSSKLLLREMDTRVKPAYDDSSGPRYP